MPNTVAIIPARGGSKRLPRKNIVDFLGQPIIAYTIKAAVDSGCFDRVLVSTDDEEISVVAEHAGAIVARRSDKLATDTSTVVEVCIDLLDREAAAGRHWQTMGCLYATAPLRNAHDVRATMKLLQPGFCGFSMAVTSYDLLPSAALKYSPDGTLTPMWPELINLRTSELPRMRVDNGSTYGVIVDDFRRSLTFYGPGLRGYDMPRERSVDIDTHHDLALAIWHAKNIGFGNEDDRPRTLIQGEIQPRHRGLDV
jgi:pseudaminic acid cytidylyltransferase